MAIRICPKCEVNYLRGDETICHICAAALKKKTKPADEDEIIMCTECGEKPAVRGKELCEDCLREQQRQADLELLADQVRDDERADPVEDDISDDES